MDVLLWVGGGWSWSCFVCWRRGRITITGTFCPQAVRARQACAESSCRPPFAPGLRVNPTAAMVMVMVATVVGQRGGRVRRVCGRCSLALALALALPLGRRGPSDRL